MGMCGPTSAVIVLNALRADAPPETKPSDPALFPDKYRQGLPPGLDPLFHRYSQQIFFRDPRVEAVKPEAAFYGRPSAPGAKPDPGLQLRQLHDILVALGLDSTIRVADEHLRDDLARQELAANLARPGDFVIVNYFRPGLGQTGGGHISPLAAYDEVSDSFLVLDVNATDRTWVWIPATRLFAAMRTLDKIENRGYLLVREGAGASKAP